MSHSCLRRSGIWHVRARYHTVLPATHTFNPQVNDLAWFFAYESPASHCIWRSSATCSDWFCSTSYAIEFPQQSSKAKAGLLTFTRSRGDTLCYKFDENIVSRCIHVKTALFVPKLMKIYSSVLKTWCRCRGQWDGEPRFGLPWKLKDILVQTLLNVCLPLLSYAFQQRLSAKLITNRNLVLCVQEMTTQMQSKWNRNTLSFLTSAQQFTRNESTRISLSTSLSCGCKSCVARKLLPDVLIATFRSRWGLQVLNLP